MGRLFSYATGIVIAGLVVFGLHKLIHFDSVAYARQITQESLDPNDLDALEKLLNSPKTKDKLAAVIAISRSDQQLKRRIQLLSVGVTVNDASVQSVCKLTLGRYGDEAKPIIRELLKSDDPDDYLTACAAVHGLEEQGDEFAEAIIEKLDSSESDVRHASLYAIQGMNADRLKGSVNGAINALDSENFNTVCIACSVLRKVGPEAKPAIEPLIRLMKEGNISVKSRATQALAAIGPVEDYDIAAIVAEGLNAFPHVQKVRTLEAIGDLGPHAMEHLDKIEHLINTPKKNCVPEAAVAYYRVSGETKMPMRVLMESLENRGRRAAAIEAIGGMGKEAAAAVPRLMDFLADEDEAILETTILTLRDIGPSAKKALPRLGKLVDHEDYLIAYAAKEAIEAIGGE